MKIKSLKATALLLSFTLLASGCSLQKNNSNAQSNADNVSSSIQDSIALDNASTADSIMVYEDLYEPEYEEVIASESASASSASAESSSQTDSSSSSASLTPTSDLYPVDDNLVMVFFGDSQFANGRSDGSDIPSLMATRIPNANPINLGIGGTTAAIELNTSNIYDYDNWTSTSFYGMVLALEGTVDRNTLLANNPDTLANMNRINPAEVDYYFIEYGANDFFNKIPIDKYNESTDEFNELHTYYGALSRGIEKLQALSPNATIILLTPFYGIYKDSMGTYLGDTYITSNGYGTLADYAKKMINISEDKGLYCFDGMFRSKHDLYLDTVDMYLMDTTHLSLLGRQAFARLLAHIPNSMEHYEPSAYRQCDFITISKFDPNETYRMPDNELEEYFNDEYQSMLRGEYFLVQPQSE
ncbi:MAG: SGNH/GDSL hydrolase family protein [Butyrivibrio sp.]|nr:SGNH/GDSL hydrolase family protein [Butyrivibrio sp.]